MRERGVCLCPEQNELSGLSMFAPPSVAAIQTTQHANPDHREVTQGNVDVPLKDLISVHSPMTYIKQSKQISACLINKHQSIGNCRGFNEADLINTS